MCARVCAHVCARACVRACVRDVFAIYDKKYLTQADSDNTPVIKIISYNYLYKSDTLMISPQRVYRLVLYNS